MSSDPARYEILRAWFERARPLDAPARRELIEELRGDDAALADELAELLNLDEATALQRFDREVVGVLDAALGSAALPAGAARDEDRAGAQLDQYRLVNRLGEGGMGTVWRAEQVDPVSREVALKVIKLGMDTREVVTRFEAERQALARMDHPCIARVLDGGATPMGRPYFVMDLVDGRPITDWAKDSGLDLHGRLELFATVCDAVQHAHGRGLIHRDLKPSNILVAERDGQPEPRIIDFGIAKAIGDPAPGEERTRIAQVLGTPGYMAPEQARGALDVDTRVDVYSLGVLLYELVTGSRPFESEGTDPEAIQVLLDAIQERVPERPSTRVSSFGSEGDSPLGRSATSLARELARDLDWIVLRALAKDRDRRYPTASAFAEDVRRYLRGEPVEATPPSTGYRLGKFVRRHRRAVLAAAALVTVFVLGSAGTAFGLWKATRANRALELAVQAKNTALEEARASEQVALTAQIETEQIAVFQEDQIRNFDAHRAGRAVREGLLNLVDTGRREELAPELGDLDFTTVIRDTLQMELFEGSVRALEDQFSEQPLVRARLLRATGRSQFGLALYEEAEQNLRRSAELYREQIGEHPSTALAEVHLGRALLSMGRVDEGRPLIEGAAGVFERELGPADQATLMARRELGAVLAAEDPEGATPYLQETYERMLEAFGPDHVSTLLAQRMLGSHLRRLRRYDEAIPLLEEALERSRTTLGTDDPDTAVAASGVGKAYSRTGRREEALELFEIASGDAARLLGRDHPVTMSIDAELGLLLIQLGQNERAFEVQTAVLAFQQRTLGNAHTTTAQTHSHVGILHQRLGNFEEALEHYTASMEGYTATMGAGERKTRAARKLLADLLRGLGRFEEAADQYELLAEHYGADLGEHHADTLGALLSLGSVQNSLERFDDAEKSVRRALEGYRATLDEDAYEPFAALSGLCAIHMARGDNAGAEPLLREAFLTARRLFGDDNSQTTGAAGRLHSVLEATGAFEAAAAPGESPAELGAWLEATAPTAPR